MVKLPDSSVLIKHVSLSSSKQTILIAIRSKQEAIKMMFVEAKWIYNYLLANDMIYNCDYKDLNFVIHKDKDRNDIKSPINHIKSSVK